MKRDHDEIHYLVLKLVGDSVFLDTGIAPCPLAPNIDYLPLLMKRRVKTDETG